MSGFEDQSSLASNDPDHFLCSISEQRGAGHGDSGGPLTVRGTGDWTGWAHVVALIKSGSDEVTENKRDNYVKLSPLCDWLKEASRNSQNVAQFQCSTKPTQATMTLCMAPKPKPVANRADCRTGFDNINCPQFRPGQIPGGNAHDADEWGAAMGSDESDEWLFAAPRSKRFARDDGASDVLNASLADNRSREITELSILNNHLAEDKSLSILSVTTLSTLEQKETKGQNDAIVRQLFARISQFERSDGQIGCFLTEQKFRELPLVPAVEASEKGPVFVVNHPFYDRNRTLSSINAPKCLPTCESEYEPMQQHNLTANGLKKLTEILSTLAKRYGEGLKQKLQLVPLVLSRRIVSTPTEVNVYKLNIGVALVAPENDGYRALTALVLKWKSESVLSIREPEYDGD
ncbi:hypothetical protein DdX_12962 [Ditylenchus destructor]|uniref:Peptidase S1 domain-containing protein n=1 Tax=Ditylenchus destructor TaxID=166010 RepID=A0AAD4MUB5_9BILA|nr:hypothetical protein DdX_12962 [Ditylenchus destructor]